jgi:bis(5'-nucleosidyl)-tetraphosphatase
LLEQLCGTLIIGGLAPELMEEHSAGAVIYIERPERKYLLLLNGGRWDFPKGGREPGESDEETVAREVREESGLSDVRLVPGFRRVIEYFYRRDGAKIHKDVTYMLGRSQDDQVVISSEHQGFGWFDYESAMKRASYDNSRMVLREAEKHLIRERPA